MTPPPFAPTRKPLPLAVAGALLVLAAVVLGAWIGWVRDQAPFEIDSAWAAWIAAHRGPVLLAFSYAMNVLGGGWFGVLAVPTAITVALVVAWRRGRMPGLAVCFYVAAALASAGVVQVLKHVVGRARPEEIIVLADVGSYPSGHVANAMTLAVVIGMLLRRRWVWIAGAVWVIAMAFSRTYLGAHFISDVIGGALTGAGVTLLVAAAIAARARLATMRP